MTRGRLALACLALLGVAWGAPPPATAALHHGAQVHPWFPGRTDAENLRELEVLASTGVDTVRMDMPWSLVEPERGRRDAAFLTRADRYVDRALSLGMKPILNLHSTPCWASVGGRRSCGTQSGFQPPDDLGELAAVSGYLAGRYASRILAFEVWNEPNLAFSLRSEGGQAGRAGDYAGMLKASFRGVKRAAPTLTVLGASLAGTDTAFLEALYARGIAGHYDAIAFHPYNGGRGPSTPRPPGAPDRYEFSYGTVRLRETMLRHGDRAPRLWMTEYGWSTCLEGLRSPCVTEAQQAAYLTEAALLVRTWFPFVEAMSWYEVRDSRESDPPGCFECGFGLLRADFSPKPSFLAFDAANGPVGGELLAGS